MIRKNIKVRNNLICSKSPYFIRISTYFIYSENSDILLILANQIELIFLLTIKEFFDFLTMRKLFKFLFTQSLIKKPNIIVNYKCNSWQINIFTHIFNLIIVIGMFKFLTIILVFLFKVLYVINPYLIWYVDT